MRLNLVKSESLNRTAKWHWGTTKAHKEALTPMLFSVPITVHDSTPGQIPRLNALIAYLKRTGYRGLLPPVIKKNTHEQVRAALLKDYAYRRSTYLLMPEVRTRLTLTAYLKRAMDEDNPNFKYLIDAIRYAGLIHDDASKWCTTTTAQAKCGKGEEPTVTIKIEYL